MSVIVFPFVLGDHSPLFSPLSQKKPARNQGWFAAGSCGYPPEGRLRLIPTIRLSTISSLASRHRSIRSTVRRMCWIVPSCTLNFHRGRAEETAPQRLGQQLRHDRLELCHFLRVAGCCAVRRHRALPYDIAGRFSRFLFGPLAEFIFVARIDQVARERLPAARSNAARIVTPCSRHHARPFSHSITIQQRSGIFQADRQHASQPCRQDAVEAESRPCIVAVLVAAPAGDELDAIDAQRRGGRHLPMKDVQAKAAALPAAKRNMKAVVDHHQLLRPRDARNNISRYAAPPDRPSRCTTCRRMRPLRLGRRWGARQSGIFLCRERAIERVAVRFAPRPIVRPAETLLPRRSAPARVPRMSNWDQRRRPDSFPTPDQASTARTPSPGGRRQVYRPKSNPRR